jgi:hypothetical protein
VAESDESERDDDGWPEPLQDDTKGIIRGRTGGRGVPPPIPCFLVDQKDSPEAGEEQPDVEEEPDQSPS